MLAKRRDLWAATLVLLGSRLATLPRSLWEFDEPLFIEAVWQYEPLSHHPPPPGYPVFIALAKLVNFIFHDPLTSLVVLSLVATLIGFVALALSVERLSGGATIGILTSLLFYFSPVMLVHSVLPISDPAGLAFLFLTLLAATRLLGYGTGLPAVRDAVLFGVLAALTVGCRPQFSIAVVPMVLWCISVASVSRLRWIAMTMFGLICLVWLVPLVLAAGGVLRFWAWLGEQAQYFAQHDAAISRGGRSWIQIAFRFIAHPWGPKWLSFAVLLAAFIGAFQVFRFRSRGLFAFAVTSIPYLIFCLLMMDPADGPRYALPSLPFVAFLAASGIDWLGRRVPFGSYAVLALFAAGSAIYTSTFIGERARSASPPVQAAEYAYRTIPRNSVILYELPLMPHARHLFKDYTVSRIDEGLTKYSALPEVPVYLYADGEPGDAEGATFRWIKNDAYGKLTRNHYRVVSLIPIQSAERYRPVEGVHPSERTVIGEQWRWLKKDASVELPDLGRSRAAVTLQLPRNYPFPDNTVTVLVNGSPAQDVILHKERPVDVVVNLPPGRPVLSFRATRSFVPANLPNSLDRDPRELSVQLLRIRQLE